MAAPLPMLPPSLLPPVRRGKQQAFSLVEVVLAIGVVAFAFVAILGLLPAGMTQFRQAIDTTVCAQIAQRVIGDAQQADFDVLIDRPGMESKYPNSQQWANFTFRAPKVNEPEYRYFDERGGEVVPSNKAARSNPDSLSSDEKFAVVYHVLVRVMPQTRVPRTGTGGTAGGDEVATITVQVAHNPGNQKLPIDESDPKNEDKVNRNLFRKAPGLNIITYSAQVARNL